jgi:hypothetical protein
MRKVNAILFGSIAALATLTAPVLAKNSDTQKADDKPVSSSCHSYRQNPDGSWTPLPCQELGPGTQAQPRPATRSVDGTTR